MSFSLWLLLVNTFWAGIAALGFAVLFNVTRGALFGCILNGALGYAVRTLLVQIGEIGIETSSLLAATVVGFTGVKCGHYWRTPALIFIVPGIIPLIPGYLAFRTMVELLLLTTSGTNVELSLLVKAIINGLKTILIIAGISVGVAIPSLLLRRHNPML